MNSRFAIEREKNNKVYYKEYENDFCFPHFHSQIELYFITDGDMDIIINNHQRLLKKGELAVSLSYDTHQYKTNRYSHSAVFIIPLYMADKFEELINKQRVAQPFISHSDSVEFIRKCIEKIILGHLSDLEIQGYIYLILGTVYKHIGFKATDEHICVNLSSKILFYLDNHFKEDVSLNSLAYTLGYSPYYISHYFKNCFYIGFNQYLTMLRLRNAVTLLSLGKFNITYCALESGFNSMRTFYRAFSKEFGKSPKEYMKHLK